MGFYSSTVPFAENFIVFKLRHLVKALPLLPVEAKISSVNFSYIKF